MKVIEGSVTAAKGFRAAGNAVGIKGKITEKGINKFIKEIYQEYPISELLFKLEDDKLVLTTLEFDY